MRMTVEDDVWKGSGLEVVLGQPFETRTADCSGSFRVKDSSRTLPLCHLASQQSLTNPTPCTAPHPPRGKAREQP